LALLALGEIGKTNDLSSLNQLTDILVSTFAHVSDDVKNAAAFALGTLSFSFLIKKS
jgi:HEAT repeat protein